MAESIYTQLENQTVLTPVNGTDFRHPLPTGLFPTAEQFESPEQLLEWADQNNFTAKLIQKGLQKAIIEVRACFKSCPKDKVWTEEMGLKNIDSMEWKSVDRPNQGGSKKLDEARFKDCMVLVADLSEMEIPMEKIKKSATKTYGEEIANEVFAQLEQLKG